MRANYLLLAACLFIGCNENAKKDAGHNHQIDSTTQSKVAEHKSELILNDGKKWKLDESTKVHIAAIKQTVQSVQGKKNADYAQLATELQSESDKLISDCKMTGKDHEMLHAWLEEFLSSLRKLKESKGEEQPKAYAELSTIVNNFDKYFE